uniref:Secreted protein n=1 Tax=Anopheles dirus TaxID=7168 RepID=A0A182N7X3_9DIPT
MCRPIVQKMNTIAVVLVVALFGTVCSSYAIDCMDVWDDDSIAEMLEDDRRYAESLRTGRDVHQQDEEEEDDNDEDTDVLVASNDEHEDEEDCDHHQNDEQHETPEGQSSQDQRQKREAPAAAQPIPNSIVQEDPSDLEVAETHLFRPVFRYKSQYTERRRVRTPAGGVNFTPSQ